MRTALTIAAVLAAVPASVLLRPRARARVGALRPPGPPARWTARRRSPTPRAARSPRRTHEPVVSPSTSRSEPTTRTSASPPSGTRLEACCRAHPVVGTELSWPSMAPRRLRPARRRRRRRPRGADVLDRHRHRIAANKVPRRTCRRGVGPVDRPWRGAGSWNDANVLTLSLKQLPAAESRWRASTPSSTPPCPIPTKPPRSCCCARSTTTATLREPRRPCPRRRAGQSVGSVRAGRDRGRGLGSVRRRRGGPGDRASRSTRGEVVAVLGPNGAGKTTTVEILEGFRHAAPPATVRVLGIDPATGGAALPRADRHRAPGGGFDPYLTVAGVAADARRLLPAPATSTRSSTWSGSTEKRDARVKTLSGGQQRRLDLGARA